MGLEIAQEKKKHLHATKIAAPFRDIGKCSQATSTTPSIFSSYIQPTTIRQALLKYKEKQHKSLLLCQLLLHG